MAGALGEEIDEPGAGLATRDYLDMRLAGFEARYTSKMVDLLGVQIVIFSLIAKYFLRAADGFARRRPYLRESAASMPSRSTIARS